MRQLFSLLALHLFFSVNFLYAQEDSLIQFQKQKLFANKNLIYPTGTKWPKANKDSLLWEFFRSIEPIYEFRGFPLTNEYYCLRDENGNAKFVFQAFNAIAQKSALKRYINDAYPNIKVLEDSAGLYFCASSGNRTQSFDSALKDEYFGNIGFGYIKTHADSLFGGSYVIFDDSLTQFEIINLLWMTHVYMRDGVSKDFIFTDNGVWFMPEGKLLFRSYEEMFGRKLNYAEMSDLTVTKDYEIEEGTILVLKGFEDVILFCSDR